MACPSLSESVSFILLLLLFRVSKANLNFTMEPSNPTYRINGSTAKLEWDYSDPLQELQSIIFSVEMDGSSGKEFKRMLVNQNGVVQEHPDLPAVYKGRVRIKGNATLVIEKITAQDNTRYKCELLGKYGDKKSLVQLTVAEAPKISLSSTHGIYNEGSSVNVSCTASGIPEPLVTWSRKGMSISSEKDVAFLTISSIQRTDDGFYICVAKNLVDITSRNTTLLVHYKPEGTTLKTSKPGNAITQGGNVTFTCAVTAAKPPVSLYRFSLNDTEVKASTDGQYTIKNVSRTQHHGNYKCVPSNNVGKGSEASLKLDVKVPVQFTGLPLNITVNESNPICLSCDASGFPAPSITWKKAEKVLSYEKHLKITSSSRSDAGKYVCSASNRVGQPKTAKAYVTVQYPPTKVEVTQSAQKSWIGQIVTFNCKSDGVPTPVLTWYRPNGSEVKGVTAKENRVQVLLRSGGDFGDYECNAANGLSPSSNRIIKITQIRTPGIPSIVTVETQASSLTVKWTAPAKDGGSPITAYRVIILNGGIEKGSVNITDSSKSSYMFVNLEKDTDYTVKVFSRNFVFEGQAAVKEVKTKPKGPPATVEVKDIPRETTESTITLRWEEPKNNGKEIKYYTVYQRIVKDGKPGKWRKIRTVTDASVTQVDVTLEKGQVYEFAVTATNELGQSVIREEMAKKVEAIQMPTGSDGSQTGNNEGMNTAIYAGAAAAGVLLIIGIIVIIVLWRRRKLSIHEEVSVERLGSENHYEAENGYQAVSSVEAAQTLQAPVPEAEANYAQVDMTKKKKDRRSAPTDDYAQVDKSKKSKKKPKVKRPLSERPGELEYAELGDLRAALAPGPSGATAAAAVIRPPVYEGTDYADISQFGVPQPDPTYANVFKGDATYSNLNSM